MRQTVITLARGEDELGRRKVRVFIDDAEAGALGRGERTAFPVAPGEHRVSVKMDWLTSPSCIVHLKPGQDLELLVSSPHFGLNQVFAVFFRSKQFFQLEKVAGTAEVVDGEVAPVDPTVAAFRRHIRTLAAVCGIIGLIGVGLGIEYLAAPPQPGRQRSAGLPLAIGSIALVSALLVWSERRWAVGLVGVAACVAALWGAGMLVFGVRPSQPRVFLATVVVPFLVVVYCGWILLQARRLTKDSRTNR